MYHHYGLVVKDGRLILADLSGPDIGSCTQLTIDGVTQTVRAGIGFVFGSFAAWQDTELQTAKVINGILVDGFVPVWVCVNGVVRTLPIDSYGRGMAFGPDGLYYQIDNLGHVIAVDSDGTQVGEIHNCAASSSGVLRVEEDGTIVMDLPDRNFRYVGGVQIFDYQRIGEWDCGRVDRRWANPPVPYLSHGTSKVMLETFETELPVHWCSMNDGVPRPCLAGPDAPEPIDFPFRVVPYRPADPEPAPVRPSMPALITGIPPTWIGLAVDPDDTEVLGNCSWSAFAGAPPNFPVADTEYYGPTIANRPLLCGLWLSDNDNSPETVDVEIAFAKARGAKALYVHQDATSQWNNANAAIVRVSASGLRALWGIHVVNGPELSFGTSTGLTINIGTFGKDPQKLLDGIVCAFQRMRDTRQEVVWITGWNKCDWPELKDWLRATVRGIGTPAHEPGYVPPLPPVKPPFVPSGPQTSKPPRNHGSGQSTKPNWWPFGRKR